MANGMGISGDPANMNRTLAYKQIAMLVRLRPDIAARIMQAGKALARNGVTADGVQISEFYLGRISPYVQGSRQTFGDVDQRRGF